MAVAVQTLVLKKFFHWTEIVSFREGEQKKSNLAKRREYCGFERTITLQTACVEGERIRTFESTGWRKIRLRRKE